MYVVLIFYDKNDNSKNAYLYPIGIGINTSYQYINIIHSMY